MIFSYLTPKSLLIWEFSPRAFGGGLCNKTLQASGIFYYSLIFEWQFTWIKNSNSKLFSFNTLKILLHHFLTYNVGVQKSGLNLVHFPWWGIGFWKLLEFSLCLLFLYSTLKFLHVAVPFSPCLVLYEAFQAGIFYH